MNDYDFLDEEQEAGDTTVLPEFSIERRTELKERFISLWNVLGNIYHRYRQTLEEQGIAYEGMLYREAIERLDADSLPYDRYVFVGFNVLNKVETRLFEALRDAGKADFYWDYDQFYLHAGNRIKGNSAEGSEDGLPDTEQTDRYAVDCSSSKEGDNHEAGEFIRHDEEANREVGELIRRRAGTNHEAGEFIRRNLEKFPSPLPENLFASFSRPKTCASLPPQRKSAGTLLAPLDRDYLERERTGIGCRPL